MRTLMLIGWLFGLFLPALAGGEESLGVSRLSDAYCIKVEESDPNRFVLVRSTATNSQQTLIVSFSNIYVPPLLITGALPKPFLNSSKLRESWGAVARLAAADFYKYATNGVCYIRVPAKELRFETFPSNELSLTCHSVSTAFLFTSATNTEHGIDWVEHVLQEGWSLFRKDRDPDHDMSKYELAEKTAANLRRGIWSTPLLVRMLMESDNCEQRSERVKESRR